MKLTLSSLLLGIGLGGSAHAFSPAIHIGVESHFSREVVTPSSFPFFRLGMDSSGSNHQADLDLRMSFEHPKANSVLSKNFFYQFEPFEFADSEYSAQISIGRRWVRWSELDEQFGLGIFNVLDSWDRLRATSQGLSGLFLTVDSKPVQFNLFASYLMIPETMPNVVIENHQFKFYHPQSVSAGPQTFDLLNRPTPLGYNLIIPNIDQILFRPSIAIMANTKDSIDPLFLRVSAARLPLNYFPMALQASLAIPIDQINVDLRPRLLTHNVLSADLAVKWNSDFHSGISFVADQILSEDTIPADYTTAALGTTRYYSTWSRWHQIKLAYIFSEGGIGADFGPYANAAHNLFSSRVLYRNAIQMQITVDEMSAKILHEFSIDANWISLDWKHAWTPKWSSVLGGDIISAEKDAAVAGGAEFLSDLRAIDRVRVGVTYVF